ncbi:hypothetical protein HK104_007975 [Borealophlyctis nickersoniae]|nr:hypothetical protein HK104_007975 [Borealophlyctis nickersoniae]
MRKQREEGEEEEVVGDPGVVELNEGNPWALPAEAWPQVGAPGEGKVGGGAEGGPRIRAFTSEEVRRQLSGILPANQRHLNDLSDHISKLTAKLRLGNDDSDIQLVIDDGDQSSEGGGAVAGRGGGLYGETCTTDSADAIGQGNSGNVFITEVPEVKDADAVKPYQPDFGVSASKILEVKAERNAGGE